MFVAKIKLKPKSLPNSLFFSHLFYLCPCSVFPIIFSISIMAHLFWVSQQTREKVKYFTTKNKCQGQPLVVYLSKHPFSLPPPPTSHPPCEFNESGYKRETAKSTQNEWQKIERRKADTQTHTKKVWLIFFLWKKLKAKSLHVLTFFVFCCQAGV